MAQSRLDKLAETGLPVWVTEFNIVAEDEDTRADYIETAMRAFFGHPAVEGILLWGFWDQSHSRGPHAALAQGDHLQVCEYSLYIGWQMKYSPWIALQNRINGPGDMDERFA